MGGLIAGVQKVELVGGESWLSHDLGSILLAVAAITAAGLAAWVATRNHRQQLEHDRSLRKEDHIRDTIDAAVASANDALLTINGFLSNVQTTEVWRETTNQILGDSTLTDAEQSEANATNEKWRRELEAERETCHPKLQTMRAVNVRLELRLVVCW